jgi:hypothetical protein
MLALRVRIMAVRVPMFALRVRIMAVRGLIAAWTVLIARSIAPRRRTKGTERNSRVRTAQRVHCAPHACLFRRATALPARMPRGAETVLLHPRDIAREPRLFIPLCRLIAPLKPIIHTVIPIVCTLIPIIRTLIPIIRALIPIIRTLIHGCD